MKAVAIFALLAIATHHTHAANVNFNEDLVSSITTRAIGDKIKKFLENFKETMKNGDESKGIPVMDPFFLKHQDIKVDDDLLNAEGEIDDLHAEGLSNFEVPHADFKIAKKNFSIELKWPTLKGKALFNIINAKIMDFIPIYGEGDVDIEAKNLTFATNAIVKLDLKNKIIELVKFANTRVSLDDLQLNARGLYDNPEFSEFISKVISDIAPQFVNDLQKELTTRIDAAALLLGNELLKQLKFDDIWGIIKP